MLLYTFIRKLWDLEAEELLKAEKANNQQCHNVANRHKHRAGAFREVLVLAGFHDCEVVSHSAPKPDDVYCEDIPF